MNSPQGRPSIRATSIFFSTSFSATDPSPVPDIPFRSAWINFYRLPFHPGKSHATVCLIPMFPKRVPQLRSQDGKVALYFRLSSTHLGIRWTEYLCLGGSTLDHCVRMFHECI